MAYIGREQLLINFLGKGC